jgi:hypothetical protein
MGQCHLCIIWTYFTQSFECHYNCDIACNRGHWRNIHIYHGRRHVANKRVASKPLTINLPDGHKVQSTHVCNITIPSLPTVLMGHILPDLALALLVGIRPLCKACCWVIFDNNKCDVKFDGNIILRGYKDPSTDLWTLPITPNGKRSPLPQSSPVFDCALHPNSTLLLVPLLSIGSINVKQRLFW